MSERPVDPDLVDVLDARQEALLLDLDVALPARVQSYDPALQVADVVPLLRRPVPRPDGTHAFEPDPVCPSVPVLWPRVGAWGLSLALAPGDTGLLVCCDGDLATWRTGDGSVVDPVLLQRHHLSHAVFVPGLHRRGAPLEAAASGSAAAVLGSSSSSGPRVVIRSGGDVEVSVGGSVRVRVAADGTVHLGDSTASSLVALATLVEARLAAIVTAYNSHTHVAPPGGGATAVPVPTITGSNSVGAARVRAT